jgi:glycerophosphoryl diester phosphodiesterase
MFNQSLIKYYSTVLIDKMKYFAHRGIIDNELENSKEAVIHTLTSADYDGIEVDLRLTYDKKVVLIHDKDTRRISREKLIISKTEYNMLEKLKLYDESYLLTLQHFIQIYKKYDRHNKKKIIFDIKDNDLTVIEHIINNIRIFGIPFYNIIILTWKDDLPCYLYRNIKIYYAVDESVIRECDIIKAKEKQYSGICLEFDNSKENIETIKLIKLLGLETNVYLNKDVEPSLKLYQNIIDIAIF